MASLDDKITDVRNGGRPNSARVTGTRSVSGTSLSCDSLSGWPTDSKVHGVTYKLDSSSNPDATTQIDFEGIVSGNTINSFTVLDGTDIGNAIGDVVEMLPTASWGQDLADAITAEHDREGIHDPTIVATLAGTQTFTGQKTLNSPILSTPTINTPVISLYNGWITGSGTWTYASATTFTVPSADAALMSVGTKIWLTQTTSKYFYVTGVSGTTITVTGGSDYTVANAAITAPYFSNAETPVGFPQWFNYTPTFANTTLGNGTVTGKFHMAGKLVNFKSKFILGSTSAVGTASTCTLPVTSVSYTQNEILGGAMMNDSGTAAYNCLVYWVTTTTVTPVVGVSSGSYTQGTQTTSIQPFTWTTGDMIAMQGSYEAA